jgi:metal-dependent amidase/aminoacylase/carboxypeptidase family protein
VINHKDQTNHVIRLAKKNFGEDNFSQDELPLSAGEDFSYYL